MSLFSRSVVLKHDDISKTVPFDNFMFDVVKHLINKAIREDYMVKENDKNIKTCLGNYNREDYLFKASMSLTKRYANSSKRLMMITNSKDYFVAPKSYNKYEDCAMLVAKEFHKLYIFDIENWIHNEEKAENFTNDNIAEIELAMSISQPRASEISDSINSKSYTMKDLGFK